MARPWKVSPLAWEDLVRPMPSLAVGATAAHPNLFPEGLEIGRRDAPRNQYLGLVLTRPKEDTFVLGLNYFDTIDGGDNEDMYRLDTTTFELKPYMGRSFEREYPEYAGHHRAAKPYLRKPPND
jgi:hypothetical protein